MKTLSYQTLRELGYQGYLLERAPERILQFGEGNFLRAFVDYFVDVANENVAFNSKTVVVQPISGGAARSRFNEQDCLYTLYLCGVENGEQISHSRVVSAVSRCLPAEEEFGAVLACARNPDLRFIVSNTTEAGIVFRSDDKLEQANVASFPGKLTRFLYERFTAFDGAPDSGFILLPCELIDNNGAVLRDCVKRYIALWSLGDAFEAWIDQANLFCSTLVDRIVPGYPPNAAERNEQNGYIDHLLDICEPFGLWVIEGPDSLKEELPFAKAGLPVIITADHTPYKQQKVRILNGAHTASACAALLCGVETVGEMMEDPLLRGYLDAVIYREVIPTLDLPKKELGAFAASVLERFQNPYIRHELISITLNVTSKWRARVLPSVLEHARRFGALPPLLIFSFAAYVRFLRGDGNGYTVSDDKEVLGFFAARRSESDAAFLRSLCAEIPFWGTDLNEIPGFFDAAVRAVADIAANGMRGALTAWEKGAGTP